MKFYLATYLLISIFFLSAPQLYAQATCGNISTYAGNGTHGSAGNGGQAVQAQLDEPNSMAVDSAGNFYIAEEFGHRVRKVSSNGIISTFAGTGTSGDSGDGGAATSARLSAPTGVAVDSSGNVYISDFWHDKIRKVNVNGIISTYMSSSLMSPAGLTFDRLDNLYVTSLGNHKVFKVANGIVTVVAGNGTQGVSGDGGLATQAQINAPHDVAVDGNGNIYITSRWDNRVRKVNANGIISTFAGVQGVGFSGDGGPATAAQFYETAGITVDGVGNAYITDNGSDLPDANGDYPGNHRIRKVSPNGIITTIAGNGDGGFSGDGGPAIQAMLLSPVRVAFDRTGNLYVTDALQRVRKIACTGTLAPTVNFTTSNSNIIEGGTANFNAVTITAQLSHASGVAVTVPLAFTGTAVRGADYTASTTSITINPGLTSGTVRITAINDTRIEATETAIVTIGTPSNAIRGSTYRHTVSIEDNDG